MTFCKKEWKNQCSIGPCILTFSPNASRAKKFARCVKTDCNPNIFFSPPSPFFFFFLHLFIYFLYPPYNHASLNTFLLVHGCYLPVECSKQVFFQSLVAPLWNIFAGVKFRISHIVFVLFSTECTPTGFHKSHILFYSCFRLCPSFVLFIWKWGGRSG